MLIVLGILQFGLAWYAKYVITNATREGARYGVIYRYDTSGNRIPPSNLTSPNRIEDVVNNYITGQLPSGSWTVPTPTGLGYTRAEPGDDLVVTVNCNNPWDLLGNFVPTLKNMTFSARTTMKSE
jgi:hypothetical protein